MKSPSPQYPPEGRFAFTTDQWDCLASAVQQLGGSLNGFQQSTFQFLGCEFLDQPASAASLLVSLRQHDWNTARTHSAFAGTRDLLVAVLIQATQPQGWWVAMRCPADYLESAHCIEAGRALVPSDGPWKPIQNAAPTKSGTATTAAY